MQRDMKIYQYHFYIQRILTGQSSRYTASAPTSSSPKELFISTVPLSCTEKKPFFLPVLPGIGKTTQAELWRDYRGGLIVNGDASLIRKVDDVWQAFGTPVHGSSPYCENRQAPIAALIALRQGKENRMERLDGYEALRFCLPELYRPKMEPETEEVVLEYGRRLFFGDSGISSDLPSR